MGIDGKGKNATIRICDFEMHKDLFDLPDATGIQRNLQRCHRNIEYKNDKQTFKEKLEEYIVTKNRGSNF